MFSRPSPTAVAILAFLRATAFLAIIATPASLAAADSPLDELLRSGRSLELAAALRNSADESSVQRWIDLRAAEGHAIALVAKVDRTESGPARSELLARIHVLLTLDRAACPRSEHASLVIGLLSKPTRDIGVLRETEPSTYVLAVKNALAWVDSLSQRPDETWVCRSRLLESVRLVEGIALAAALPLNPDRYRVSTAPESYWYPLVPYWHDNDTLFFTARAGGTAEQPASDQKPYVWNVRTNTFAPAQLPLPCGGPQNWAHIEDCSTGAAMGDRLPFGVGRLESVAKPGEGGSFVFHPMEGSYPVPLPFGYRDVVSRRAPVRHLPGYSFMTRPPRTPGPELWLLRSNGKVDRTRVPSGPWKDAPAGFAFTAVGPVIWSAEAAPFEALADKYLGLYLIRSGSLIKVATGVFDKVVVSPDGCRAASVVRSSSLRGPPGRLRIIDFCPSRG